MADLLTSRNVVGAAIGGLVGFFVGGPFGAGAGALLGGTVAKTTGEQAQFHGEMTPQRRLIFSRAMENIGDPKELETLANAYQAQGLMGEANMLRKRAQLRRLPESVQHARRDAFRKAMASNDPIAIEQLGDAFLHEGALRAAKALKDHANAVRAALAAGQAKAPASSADLERFAENLGKAVLTFGTDSKEAKNAAGNLVNAQGRPVTPELVNDAISAAASVVLPKPAVATTEKEPVMVDNNPPATGDVIEATATVVEEKTG